MTDKPRLEHWHEALRQLLVHLSLPRHTGDVGLNRVRNQDFGILNLISDLYEPPDAALTRVLIRDIEQALADVTDFIAEQQKQVCLCKTSAHERH